MAAANRNMVAAALFFVANHTVNRINSTSKGCGFAKRAAKACMAVLY